MKKSILLAKLEAHVAYLLDLLNTFLYDTATTLANYMKINNQVIDYQRRIVILKYQCNKQAALS